MIPKKYKFTEPGTLTKPNGMFYAQLRVAIRKKKGKFTRRDFPQFEAGVVRDALSAMKRAGEIKEIKKAGVGRYAEPGIYRLINNGNQP